MEIVRSGFPMERIAVDILDELPITERGNRYILEIKWTECHAMPNMEPSTAALILVEQVVSRFGIPYFIHSDQGRQFERNYSQKCANYCKSRKPELPRTIQSQTVWWNVLTRHLQLSSVLLLLRHVCNIPSSSIISGHTIWILD